VATDITAQHQAEEIVSQKNAYLEHAAKILRHDMHSGINTYMPRGLSSLRRRLNDETIKELRIEAPLKMLDEGLKHTQKVYAGVKEFTNLVKEEVQLDTKEVDLKEILLDYLSSTSYIKQVVIDDLITTNINEPLFCTAIDNLIRNGLKYNDSGTKTVMIFMEDNNTLCVQDNGRGMTQAEFENFSKPYIRKEGQKESGSGLGLNICIAILKEHGFDITAEKCNPGTKLKIKLK
jgi:signal transduction histidine kinase